MRTAAIVLLLSASLCHSAEPRVAYTLHCYAPGTSTVVESVKQGQEFDLALTAQDLRMDFTGMRRGVYAGYANLNYGKRYAELLWVQHTAPYVNGKHKGIVDNGLAAWGGSRALGNGDTKPAEVSRIRFRALWPAGVASTAKEVTASFRLQFSSPVLTDLRQPLFNTVLYGTKDTSQREAYFPGEQSFVLPDEISATGVSVRILK